MQSRNLRNTPKQLRVSKRLLLLTRSEFEDALQLYCPACFADVGELCGPLSVPLALQAATHAERHALARFCENGRLWRNHFTPYKGKLLFRNLRSHVGIGVVRSKQR